VDPIAGLDAVEKRKFLTLCRPVRSYSVYLLRYPGPYFVVYKMLLLHRMVFPKDHKTANLMRENVNAFEINR
jgi:hypothetical protein